MCKAVYIGIVCAKARMYMHEGSGHEIRNMYVHEGNGHEGRTMYMHESNGHAGHNI